jgi:hypothetical protein
VIGIRIGLLVNLIVWPPLRDLSAAAQIEAVGERIAALMTGIARQLDETCTDTRPDDSISATDDLDGDLDQAWVILRQARESGRLNPRPAVADRMRATEGFAAVLDQLSQAVAETRRWHARSAWHVGPPERWPSQFRGPFLELLARAGAAVTATDPAARSARSAASSRCSLRRCRSMICRVASGRSAGR